MAKPKCDCPKGQWCEHGYHWVDERTVSGPCPVSAKALKKAKYETREERETRQARTLAEHLKSEQRVVSMAERIVEREGPTRRKEAEDG